MVNRCLHYKTGKLKPVNDVQILAVNRTRLGPPCSARPTSPAFAIESWHEAYAWLERRQGQVRFANAAQPDSGLSKHHWSAMTLCLTHSSCWPISIRSAVAIPQLNRYMWLISPDLERCETRIEPFFSSCSSASDSRFFSRLLSARRCCFST